MSGPGFVCVARKRLFVYSALHRGIDKILFGRCACHDLARERQPVITPHDSLIAALAPGEQAVRF